MVYGKYCGNGLLYVTQYGGNIIKNYEDSEGSQAVILNNSSAKI
jgi:hypothetical protein